VTRSPLLDRPGAVEAIGPDAGVAWHYGDPMAEQRRLAEGAALVDLSHRGVVRLAGPDRLALLQGLTSQDVAALEPGRVVESLVLSPTGHVEHHLVLYDDGSVTWAHVEPGTAAPLVAFLAGMRFLLQVDVDDVSADWAVVADPMPRLLPRAELASYGGSLAGTWTWEALRIAAHHPRLGVDTDDRTIPHEVGWVGGAVHLSKGCYRGQETVARVHNLGRPPRRLVLLHLDGSVERLPAPGDVVTSAGEAVGRMGSAARHYELGPIGLALVKRALPVDAVLEVDGIPAGQEVVVDPEVGNQAAREARAAFRTAR
jgi:folate-binding protein YgfZ